jgi:hypothetical protein
MAVTGQEYQSTSLDELLQAYPDVSVVRDRIGDIMVWEKLPDGNNYCLKLFLTKEDPNRLDLDVKISARKEPGEPEREYTFLTVASNEDQEFTTVRVKNKPPDVEPGELIAKAKQGLEIFNALINTNPEERLKYRSRACDYSSQNEELSFDQRTKYMLKILSKQIGKIEIQGD